ncbi:MAG: Fe-S cluster assembly protein SufD [Holophagae bacterium]|jgi:Fe-S cluster assembly protein SufD
MTTPASTEAFAAALDAVKAAPAPDLLRDLRAAGLRRFESLGLPTRRQEAWRLTRLGSFDDITFNPPAGGSLRGDVSRWRREGCHTLVFVDGIYSPDDSHRRKLPDGVVVSNLMLGSVVDSELLGDHLDRAAGLDSHSFAALNSALLADGAIIHLPEDVVIEQPIQLIFVPSGSTEPTVRAPRVLIVGERGSRAVVEEHHVGEGGPSLSCPVTEIVLGEGARLDHVVVQRESSETTLLATRGVRLAASSRYSAQTISLGSSVARSDIRVEIEGSNAEASLDGLAITDDRQQAETHLTMRHRVPDCQSHQLYKGVLGGRSRTAFTGRIIVDQDAQRTDATQSNGNLLLSDDATANSNPQLEIFADDVRCTHGSTVGRLDDEAVFYLRSRGIGAHEARRLLTVAFAGEILDRIGDEALREELRSEVEAKLDRMATSGPSS